MQLPDQLVQQIVNYLKQKPREEVASIISGIIEASKLEKTEKAPLEKKPK